MPSDTQTRIEKHVTRLRCCRRCLDMHPPPVTGRPVSSPVLLVGQAPGDKEPVLGRPFAWTAGKTLFRWFATHGGIDEERFRSTIYMAAVCRCFPGKNPGGGDRVPADEEIVACSAWMETEFKLLQPKLVIPVGKLAIRQFLPEIGKLVDVIGHAFRVSYAGVECDVVPLPHPSGASPWHRTEPGVTLVRRAMERVAAHPAFLAATR